MRLTRTSFFPVFGRPLAHSQLLSCFFVQVFRSSVESSWVLKKKETFENFRSQMHPETGCFCKLARFLTNPEYAFKRTCQNSWCIDHFQSKTSFFTLCMALIWEDSNRKLLSISKLRKWTYQRSLQKLIVFFVFCKQFNYRFILKVPRCSYILWIISSYLRVSA